MRITKDLVNKRCLVCVRSFLATYFEDGTQVPFRTDNNPLEITLLGISSDGEHTKIRHDLTGKSAWVWTRDIILFDILPSNKKELK